MYDTEENGVREGLTEVKEVFEKCGLTRKQLHQCDTMNLVKPTKILNDAGYKLYDEAALDRLYEVGLYAGLGLSIQEIKEKMDRPDYSRKNILEDIIGNLKIRCEHVQNQLAVAEHLRLLEYRDPEYDSYIIKHMDEMGHQYRKLIPPLITEKKE